MDVKVNGKNMEVGEAFRSHAAGHLTAQVEKYFSRAIDANVTLSRHGGRGFRVDISVHPGRGGLLVQGSAETEDAYAAFDAALEKIAKQLRRYKRRLVNHHKKRGTDEIVAAQQYVIAPDTAEEVSSEESPPVIIAEMPAEIATLTVGEAVMGLDLADAPALMFRNRANGAFNVVYRRPDGNIGWIDPTNTKRS
jgi:ribosomal subunit interface protein